MLLEYGWQSATRTAWVTQDARPSAAEITLTPQMNILRHSGRVELRIPAAILRDIGSFMISQSVEIPA